MSKVLKIAPGLTLPLDIATEKTALLGGNNSGKSYTASKLVEEMYLAGAHVVVLDNVGMWHGLRRDGKGKALDILVLGGLYGDMPLNPLAGATIADFIIDHMVSVVLDISQFDSDAQQERFAYELMTRLYKRRAAEPAAICIVLEECHEFIPQNLPPKEQGSWAPKMLHAFTRAVKIGRNYGFGFVFITQTPQAANKKSLNLSEFVLCFRQSGKHERKNIVDWLGAQTKTDLYTLLPTLKQGEPYCWSPGLLGIDGFVDKVFEKRTADISKTPKVGQSATESKPLLPIDVERLRKAMAAEIETQKSNDPKLLKARIAELEKELKHKQKGVPAAAPVAATVRVDPNPELKAQNAALRQDIKARDQHIAGLQKNLRLISNLSAATKEKVVQALDGVSKLAENPGALDVRPIPAPLPDAAQQPARAVQRVPQASVAHVVADGITRPQQRMLDTLALMESLGGDHVQSRSNLGYMMGVTPTSGSFVNNLGALRTRGLLEYPGRDTVCLTDDGRAAANAIEPPSRAELQQIWLSKVTRPQAAKLGPLIECYPEQMTREALAELLGVTAGSGSFVNDLGRLRSLGLIDYEKPNFVFATAMLFPEGTE